MRAGLSSLSARQVPSCRRALSAALLSAQEPQRTLHAHERAEQSTALAAVPCELFLAETQGARSEIYAGTLSPVTIIKGVMKNASAVNKRAVVGFPRRG